MNPPQNDKHAVTGAYGFSGQYIARRLLSKGKQVVALSNSGYYDPSKRRKARDPSWNAQIRTHPLCFDQPDELTRTLQGVSVLYNNYWIRFNHRHFSISQAVENSRILFRAAREAGVGKVVHVSITNPSVDSPLEYFRGKALVEHALKESGLPHAILRPALLFGKNDILINNIAWLLRRFPVFGVFGDGSYKVQPIFVDDLARIAITKGGEAENSLVHAVGPETFTFRELVVTIGRIIGKQRPIFSIQPEIGYFIGRVIGALKKDTLLTREEIQGLMENKLWVDEPPAGDTRLTEWAAEHASILGVTYNSEMARR